MSPALHVILLGCVKTKSDRRAPACDLYTSQLWKGRRAYAELSGLPWRILSAEYGLLAPDQAIDPYDSALSDFSAAARRAWGRTVSADLKRTFGDLRGAVFETHAGSLYRLAVAPSLVAAGAQIDAPLASFGLGQQLAWYRDVTQAIDRRAVRPSTGSRSERSDQRDSDSYLRHKNLDGVKGFSSERC